jgi:ACT domain-containing protein
VDNSEKKEQMAEVINKVNQLVKSDNLTIYAACKKIGISHPTYYKWRLRLKSGTVSKRPKKYKKTKIVDIPSNMANLFSSPKMKKLIMVIGTREELASFASGFDL